MTLSPHPGMCQNTLDLGKATSFAFFIELFPTAGQPGQGCGTGSAPAPPATLDPARAALAEQQAWSQLPSTSLCTKRAAKEPFGYFSALGGGIPRCSGAYVGTLVLWFLLAVSVPPLQPCHTHGLSDKTPSFSWIVHY